MMLTVVITVRRRLDAMITAADVRAVYVDTINLLLRARRSRDGSADDLFELVRNLSLDSQLWPIVNAVSASRFKNQSLAESYRLVLTTANLGRVDEDNARPDAVTLERDDVIERPRNRVRDYAGLVRCALRGSVERLKMVRSSVEAARARVDDLRRLQQLDNEYVSLHRSIERMTALLDTTRESLATERLNLATRVKLQELEQRFDESDARIRAEYGERTKKQLARQYFLSTNIGALIERQKQTRAVTERLRRLQDALYTAVTHTINDAISRVTRSCMTRESAVHDVVYRWPTSLFTNLKNVSRDTLTDIRMYLDALTEPLQHPNIVSCTDLQQVGSLYRAERVRDAMHSKPERYRSVMPDTLDVDDMTRVTTLETERLIAALWVYGSRDITRSLWYALFSDRSVVGDGVSRSIQRFTPSARQNEAIVAEIFPRVRALPADISRLVVGMFAIRYCDTSAALEPRDDDTVMWREFSQSSLYRYLETLMKYT